MVLRHIIDHIFKYFQRNNIRFFMKERYNRENRCAEKWYYFSNEQQFKMKIAHILKENPTIMYEQLDMDVECIIASYYNQEISKEDTENNLMQIINDFINLDDFVDEMSID